MMMEGSGAGGGEARMTPSMTIAERAAAGVMRVQREAWGLWTKQYKLPGNSVTTAQDSGVCK